MPNDGLNERFVPRRGDCFRRANRCVVGELDITPAGDLEQRLGSARYRAFGMDDLSVAQIDDSAMPILHDLDRAAAFAQTTHLKNVENVKQIGGPAFGARGCGCLGHAAREFEKESARDEAAGQRR